MKHTANIFAILLPLLSLVISSLTGCRHASYSPALEEIDRLIAQSPDSALAQLGRISPDSLSEPDRNLHRLLSIKAADKANQRLSSDSVIKSVVEYCDRIPDDSYYPSAQYYAGRVYSNIGDYGLALSYFHKALDRLPENSPNKSLRGDVLSQLAFHLNALRLYDQALVYLEKVIEIEEQMRDTVNLVLDLRLKGAILMHSNQYEKAETVLDRAGKIASDVSDNLAATIDTYRAAVKYNRGLNDSALSIIRGLPERITDATRNVALSYAAQIYNDCGEPDTAYRYAMELVSARDSKNIKTGYNIILSSQLKNWIPKDSVAAFYERYGRLVQQFVDRNDSEAALIQVSLYNYSVKERDKLKAEESRNRFEALTIVILSVSVIALSVLLFFYRRSRKKIISLLKDISDLKALNRIMRDKLPESQTTGAKSDKRPDGDIDLTPDSTDTGKRPRRTTRYGKMKIPFLMSDEEKKLGQELKDELLNLAVKTEHMPDLSSAISDSGAYKELRECISESKIIPDNSELWQRLALAVEKESHEFKHNLELLTGDNLTEPNYKLALLIKCRIRPAEIARLTNRQKSSITSRRTVLRKKMLDERMDSDVFDKIIQLL